MDTKADTHDTEVRLPVAKTSQIQHPSRSYRSLQSLDHNLLEIEIESEICDLNVCRRQQKLAVLSCESHVTV